MRFILFIRIIGIILLLVALYLVIDITESPNIQEPPPSPQRVEWTLISPWNQAGTKILYDAIEGLAQDITIASDSLLIVAVKSPKELDGYSGNLLSLFYLINENQAQMLHGSGYYWSKEIPAAAFFSSVPFGKEYNEMQYWIQKQNVLDIWRDLYKDYDIIPYACGHTGNQMGGWFNKKINNIGSFQGLHMRIPGLGGKVLEKLGAKASSLPPHKIWNHLSARDSNTAAEWIGPYDDYRLELYEVAKYYYEPGWQEPNTMFEILVNKRAMDKLEPNLKKIVETAIEKYNNRIVTKYQSLNKEYKEKLHEKTTIKKFPKSVLRKLKQVSAAVIQEYIKADTSGKSEAVYNLYK